jgi:hypothetical protein
MSAAERIDSAASAQLEVLTARRAKAADAKKYTVANMSLLILPAWRAKQ